MLTESPKRVLVIGLGTGVTAGAIANQANVEIVDVCEINSAVSEQLKHFDFATFDASTNSKINIIPADVVKYLLRSPQQYDIIVSIPSNFWVAGMENLMTPEFYEIANQNLAVGGTFIQWIPEYGFSEPGLLMLIRSFMSSFDSSSMWRLTQNDLILMYQKDSADFHQWLDKRLLEPIFLDTMDKIDFFSPKSLIYAQIAGPELLSQLAPKGKVHSLNKPGLGITALQALYHPDAKYSAENTIHRLTREHAAQLKTSTQLEPKPASPGKSANKSKFILNAVDNES